MAADDKAVAVKHKCVKHSRVFCVWCITQSLAFPIEHVLWEKAPILSAITHMLGV